MEESRYCGFHGSGRRNQTVKEKNDNFEEATPPTSVRPFFKAVVCPSAETLLAYGDSLPIFDEAGVETHLASCDFCNAELQLLTRYRASKEQTECGDIPPDLRRLAEQLLKNVANTRSLSREF
jgi:hypothetical protein